MSYLIVVRNVVTDSEEKFSRKHLVSQTVHNLRTANLTPVLQAPVRPSNESTFQA